jgi:outer membrane protein OmpA-like peptidoglycan-associated protein
MRSIRIVTKVLILFATLTALVASLPAPAIGATEDVTIKGPIISHEGDSMVMRGEFGNVTVNLTKDTKVYMVKGWLCIRREEMGLGDLIPGLLVEVDAQRADGQTTAQVVRFGPRDLKTARSIQAGLEITKQQLQAEQEKNIAQAKEIEENRQKIDANRQAIEANRQEMEKNKAEDAAMMKRFGDLDEYDLKGEATILFDVNSAVLSDKAKKDLQSLAATAKGVKGYMIQVAGFTDSSGRADLNQALSDARAESVVVFLRVSCDIPIYRVVFPAAMGQAKPVASNETDKGKAENRRAVAQIIANRGLFQ